MGGGLHSLLGVENAMPLDWAAIVSGTTFFFHAKRITECLRLRALLPRPKEPALAALPPPQK